MNNGPDARGGLGFDKLDFVAAPLKGIRWVILAADHEEATSPRWSGAEGSPANGCSLDVPRCLIAGTRNARAPLGDCPGATLGDRHAEICDGPLGADSVSADLNVSTRAE